MNPVAAWRRGTAQDVFGDEVGFTQAELYPKGTVGPIPDALKKSSRVGNKADQQREGDLYSYPAPARSVIGSV